MIEIDWDNLPPTTIPASTTISVRDFTSKDAAKRLGEAVAGVVKMMS